MHFLQTAITALSAASLITTSLALPTATTEKRGLCTIQPSFIKHLSKNNSPLYHYYQGAKPAPISPDEFIIASGPGGGSNSNYEVRTGMKFIIPPGATGCRLQVSNRPKINKPYKMEGSIDTSVFRVTDVCDGHSWDKPPTPLASQPGVVYTTDWLGPQTNAWSGNCDKQLSFLFTHSDWQTGAGELNFVQSSQDGFSIIYDC